MTAEVFKAIYISAISLGCLTLLILLTSKKGERRIDIAISMLVVGLMMSPLNAYTMLILDKPIQLLLFLSQTLTWLYGPLLYLILQYIQLKQVKPIIVCLHFVPSVLILFERMSGLVNSVMPSAVIAAFFIQATAYLVYCLITLYRRKKRFLHVLREFKNGTYFWLSYLVPTLVILTLWDTTIVSFYLIRGTLNMQILSVIGSGASIAVCAIAFLIVYQPRRRSSDAEDVPGTNQHIDDFSQITNGSSNSEPERAKLRNIELPPGTVAELKSNLERLMLSHQLYLEEDISLAKLSALLGVNRNQLSELFNVHLETSFYDYMNDYRYQAAIKLLTDTHCEFTVSDIAYRSGFNNRNSFYRVFKEKMGVTPTEYRRSLLG